MNISCLRRMNIWQLRMACSLLLGALSLPEAHAQPAPHCGFEALLERQTEEDPSLAARFQLVEAMLAPARVSIDLALEMRTEMVIPVVVHIVWNTPEENLPDERVWSQIEILNRDFNAENQDVSQVPSEFSPFIAQNGIRFCLASKDPWGNPTSGIIRVKTDIDFIGMKEELYYTQRGGSDAWDTDKYFNIWVARTGDLISGFGTFPQQVSPERQGIVVHPRFFGPNNSRIYQLGRVAVHEAGHFFGLHHIWHNNASCTVDDGIEDTPLQQRSYRGCPSHPQITCGSADMFMNFMDYVNDECMYFFTQGQMERMKAVIHIFRPGLLQSSTFCIKENVPAAAFRIWPNPTIDRQVTIRLAEPFAGYGVLAIYTIMGQLAYSYEGVLFDGMKVDLYDIPAGIYWIKIGEHSQKVVVIQ